MLTIGDPAPDFSLPGVVDDQLREFSLRALRGRWLSTTPGRLKSGAGSPMVSMVRTS